MNEEDSSMYQQDEEEGEPRKSSLNLAAAERFYKLYNNWPSSRIIRVSRASGGKDRHSKVLTSKGLRDRRVRLSVTTAIQFYDLQDRLGYDQPSKAFEWLLKAASTSIDELPPISSPFFLDAPPPPKQNQVTVSDKAEAVVDMNNGRNSRSEGTVRARKRAKERVLRTEAKDGEKDGNGCLQMKNPNNHVVSRTSSFTELLSGGGAMILGNEDGDNHSQNRQQQWNRYLGTQGLIMDQQHHHHLSSTFGGCNESNNLMNLAIISSSSSLGRFDRGTLQSNNSSLSLSSESILSSQRFNPQQANGFFFSSSSSPMAAENDHHFRLSGFEDARLQLCYGNVGDDNRKVKGGKN